MNPARTVTLFQGDRVVRSRADGTMDRDRLHGYFVDDTRMVATMRWSVADAPIEPVRTIVRTNQHAVFRSTIAHASGPLDVRIDRRLGAVGLRDDIVVCGHETAPVTLTLRLDITTDFADLFELRGLIAPIDREVSARWAQATRRLRFRYTGDLVRREVAIDVVHDGALDATRSRRGLHLQVRLDPGGRWSTSVRIIPVPGRNDAAPRLAPVRLTTLPPPPAAVGPSVRRVWRRAMHDIESLRLTGRWASDDAPLVAGIPWYAALFGRDALLSSILLGAARPDIARGTLEVLARYQAVDDDARRDMEPGKLPHELRVSESVLAGRQPFGPYYGSHDATPLYVIALDATVRHSGDLALAERHWATVGRALDWLERYGDRDGDGFQEYAPRTPTGFPNQGWRDSWDAIVDEDGRRARPPIALAEHQGYAFDAWTCAAVLADLLGDRVTAERSLEAARRLFERFNETFWWESEGTVVLGLDGDKRPIRTVASSAGHCLWSGIVPAERAARMVRRLRATDIDSGWGLRTISADHVAFDPSSYHRGSVWPFDTAIAVAGFRRYGFHVEADDLATRLLEAAIADPDARLPEMFGGDRRIPGRRPRSIAPRVGVDGADDGDARHVGWDEAATILTQVNVPQAWSAASVVSLVAGLARLDAVSGR